MQGLAPQIPGNDFPAGVDQQIRRNTHYPIIRRYLVALTALYIGQLRPWHLIVPDRILPALVILIQRHPYYRKIPVLIFIKGF